MSITNDILWATKGSLNLICYKKVDSRNANNWDFDSMASMVNFKQTLAKLIICKKKIYRLYFSTCAQRDFKWSMKLVSEVEIWLLLLFCN